MNKVIATVTCEETFSCALNADVEIIFDISSNIMTISDRVERAHSVGKRYFLHIDLAEGIGKDKYGLLFVKRLGVDGIISTKTMMIKTANEVGLSTVQRFFMVDTQSIETTGKALVASKAEMIEILPGNVSKVIARLRALTDVPIIAGGLIETVEEIQEAIKNGAAAISTGKSGLWTVTV